MEPNQPHIIHQQILDLSLPSSSHLDYRQEARDFAEELAQTIEQVLDSWAGPHQWVILDRLDLDIQGLNPQDWRQEALDQIKNQLMQRGFSGSGKPGTGEGDSIFLHPDQRRDALISYLLGHGYLPWWYTLSPFETLPIGEWIDQGAIDPRLMQGVGDRALWDRWMEIMGDQVFRFLSQWEPIRSSENGKSFLKLYQRLMDSGLGSLRSLAKNLVKKLVGSHWARQQTPAHFTQVIQDPLSQVSWGQLPPESLSILKRALQESYAIPLSEVGSDQDQNRVKVIAKEDNDRVIQDAEGQRWLGVEEEMPPSGPTESRARNREIMTSYGGMVILAPFLPLVFDNLGIRPWENEEDLYKASQVWDTLAFGHPHIGWSDRVLFKILMGLDPGLGMETGSEPMSHHAQEEAALFLDQLALHWEKLGKSSGEAIRSHFFQRKARLMEGDRGWTMTVTPEAVDVLIPFLPWTISLIKLPWMEKPLYTEWNP